MKNNIIKKIVNKLIYTLMVVVLLTIANNTLYPGISRLVYQYSEFNKAVFETCVITSQGIRPNILAGIIINLITSIFQYFNNMQKSNETKHIYEKIYIVLIVVLSISYSLIQYKVIIPLIHSNFKHSFFALYALINVAIALFFTWLNRRMLINGLGNGTTVILTIQILNKFINSANIHSIANMYATYYHNIVYLVCMLSLCVIFERINICLPIIALQPKSAFITTSAKQGMIKYKPMQSNVTAHVLTAQVKNISIFIGNLLYNTHNIETYNFFYRYLSYFMHFVLNINSVISQCFYFISILIFNFIYNTVYYNRLDRIVDNMRNNICYVVGVRISDIVYHMNIAAAQCSVVALCITIILMVIPKLLDYVNMKHSIDLNPIDLMIISSAFMHFKKFLSRLFSYYEFNINSNNLVYRISKVKSTS